MQYDMWRKAIRSNIEQSVCRFLAWLQGYGFESYDQFDFWGSEVGVKGKQIFLKNRIAGAPIVGPLQILESFLPASRRLFAKPKRFAIGDAHFAMGFMNLFRYEGKDEYIEKAKEIGDHLVRSATVTQNGLGWGYPYVWVTESAIYQKGTPFITVTPYCFYAFLRLYDLAGDKTYLTAAEKAARFAAYDMNESELSDMEAACSYSPMDHGKVINANAYRSAMLLKAYELFGVEDYREKAKRNIRFVLKNQNSDGSWFYSPDSRFIDNFHTCFVLKNLYKAYAICKDPDILNAVKDGYAYYRKLLFRADNTPIHFARIRYPKFRKIEMYDYAEGISLGVLLKDAIPGALEFAEILAHDLITKFQLPDGHFVTRTTTLGTKNKIPYLRWPQAQVFCALTNLLLIQKG
jgi:hypothetical protein